MHRGPLHYAFDIARSQKQLAQNAQQPLAVDLEFDARCKHFVPLALLRGIAAGNEAVEYVSEDDAKAVKGAVHWQVDCFRVLIECRDGTCWARTSKRAAS